MGGRQVEFFRSDCQDARFGRSGRCRKDFYTLTEKGLDLIPLVLNIVLWSAKYDSKSYVRRRKEFVARLSQSPLQVSEEVKALVRNGGCMFPESKE